METPRKDDVMKKLCIVFAVFACAVLFFGFAGCIESTTLVRVNKDGSGEVEEMLLMRTDVLQMFKGMGEEMGGESDDLELLDRAKLEKQAGQMGEGVELKSVEPLTTDSHTGYKALYTFKDINKLEVNENPDENVPDAGSPGDAAPQREIITFQFEKATAAKPASLVINLPEEIVDESSGETEEMPSEQSEDMINMFREIFKDMKINVSLEVEGEIIETNATHAEGSKIILMAIDFNEIIRNEQVFRELALENPDTLEETKDLLKDVPGIKVELQDSVELQFE
jgi:hypothetical protein